MFRQFFLYLSHSKRLQRWTATKRTFRRLVRRFVAGETLAEAVTAVRTANSSGKLCTLDVLGENVLSESAAHTAAEAYLTTLEEIQRQHLQSNISIKLTQLGLDIHPDLAQELLDSIAERAKQLGNSLEVDMESSKYTESTLNIVKFVHSQHGNLGVAIQAYLYRSEKDIRSLLPLGLKIRLVKGAYKESPIIAYPRKKQVNENFIRLTHLLLASDGYHALATHDPHMIQEALEFMRQNGRDKHTFEFEFLHGISVTLQEQLHHQGFRVRIYVPFGTHWYPYFMRRLAERPANVFFLLRNLMRR